MIEKSDKRGGLHWHTLGSKLLQDVTLLDTDDLTAVIKELLGGEKFMNKNNPLSGLAGMFGLGGNSGNPLGALTGMFGGGTQAGGNAAGSMNPMDILGVISSLGGGMPNANANAQSPPVNNQGNGNRGNRRPPPPREPAYRQTAASDNRQAAQNSRPHWNYSGAPPKRGTAVPRRSNRPDISNIHMPQRYSESRDSDANSARRETPPREPAPQERPSKEHTDSDSMWYFGESSYK